MTPFGYHVRKLRQRQGITQVEMATALGVSPAYLSALEHGRRGRPGTGLVQQISAFFNLAWDEVDELKRLAQLSVPKCTVDTAGLGPKATELANIFAAKINDLDDDQIDRIFTILTRGDRKPPHNDDS